MSKPPTTPRKFWWLAVLVVSVSAACWLGVRVIQGHRIVAASIPVRPVLSDRPAELTDKIAEAEEGAGGYFHPARGLVKLSRLYYANGFYNEAMQCYEGLQRLEPGEARWPHLEANILAGFGRLDDALPLWQRASTLAPDYVPARLRLGDVQLKANQIPASQQTYMEVLRLDAGNPYALLGLAKGAIIQGDWPKARDQLQQAVRLHPDFIGALSLLVTVSEHFNDLAAADALRETIGKREFSDLPDPWMDELLDECYDPYRLSVASAVAKFAGDWVMARRWLERAVELAPEAGTYHRQLGVLLTHVPDYGSARQQLEKAVALSPNDADAWLLLYQVLTNMNETEAAERALSSGLAYCPLAYSLHMERARRWNATGHMDEAIIEFREACRLQPTEAGPLIELASDLFAVNRGGEAVAVLHEALQRQPEHPIALATLSFYAINNGDEAEALAWWDHVRRQTRTPPQVRDSLNQAFQKRFGRPLF